VILSVFGAVGVLMLATTRSDWRPGVVIGSWLLAFWLAGCAWLVWARSIWVEQREDLILHPSTARGVYARAGGADQVLRLQVLRLVQWACAEG
jgi:hypothetical protein